MLTIHLQIVGHLGGFLSQLQPSAAAVKAVAVTLAAARSTCSCRLYGSQALLVCLSGSTAPRAMHAGRAAYRHGEAEQLQQAAKLQYIAGWCMTAAGGCYLCCSWQCEGQSCFTLILCSPARIAVRQQHAANQRHLDDRRCTTHSCITLSQAPQVRQ